MTTTTGKAEDPAETARWEADKARVPSDPAAPDRPKRYRVALTTWANTSVEVEAGSPDEAKRLAEESGEFPTLCHQCSGYGHGPYLELGDEWNAVEASAIGDDDA